VRPKFSCPPKVQCNLEVPTLKAGKATLYFFPDRLLVYDSAKAPFSCALAPMQQIALLPLSLAEHCRCFTVRVRTNASNVTYVRNVEACKRLGFFLVP